MAKKRSTKAARRQKKRKQQRGKRIGELAARWGPGAPSPSPERDRIAALPSENLGNAQSGLSTAAVVDVVLLSDVARDLKCHPRTLRRLLGNAVVRDKRGRPCASREALEKMQLARAAQDDQRLMTYGDVATYLRVSERTVWSLVKSGEIASVRVGRLVRIRLAAVLAYLNPPH